MAEQDTEDAGSVKGVPTFDEIALVEDAGSVKGVPKFDENTLPHHVPISVWWKLLGVGVSIALAGFWMGGRCQEWESAQDIHDTHVAELEAKQAVAKCETEASSRSAKEAIARESNELEVKRATFSLEQCAAQQKRQEADLEQCRAANRSKTAGAHPLAGR